MSCLIKNYTRGTQKQMSTKIPTAVQQIMLGTVTKNEQQAKATLAAIKGAGYDGIELNGFMIHPTSFLVRAMTKAADMPVGNSGKLDWKKLIKDSGLSVLSLHTDLGSLKRDAGAVAAEAKDFGAGFVVITGMYRFDYGNEEALQGLCADLNACGKALVDSGLRLLYHNHNVEFRNLPNGGTAYDYIIAHTDNEAVNFEFDSYWPAEAGANVHALMKSLGSRMKLWHINDRGARAVGPSMTPILTSDSMELGTGNMDLEGLCAIAEENGIEGVVLESHKNWIDKDPIKSLQFSAKFLQSHF